MKEPGRRAGAVASGFFLILGTLLLARYSDLERTENVLWFVGAGLGAGLAYLGALTGRIDTGLLWLVAIVARLVLLPAAPGDDLRRYQWEGRVQAAGFNPYVLAPQAPELAPLRDGDWEKMPHKTFAAAYPPAAELVFRALAGQPALLWKLVFALADLGVIALLVAWRRDDPRVAAAYGWNPLVLYAFAGGAHFDSLLVLVLVAAAFLLRHLDRAAAAAGSCLLLGLAIALKAVPVVLVPVWAFALGWRRWPWLLLAPLPGLAGALAFGWPETDLTAGLRAFGRVARTNDCLWWLVELVRGERIAYNDTLQAVQLAACAGLAWLRRREPQRAILWVLGAFLLLSPVLHPWYLAWILPFAALAGETAAGWRVFAVSSFAYFLLWLHPLPWQQSPWLRLAILLPPLAATLAVLARARRDDPRAG